MGGEEEGASDMRAPEGASRRVWLGLRVANGANYARPPDSGTHPKRVTHSGQGPGSARTVCVARVDTRSGVKTAEGTGSRPENPRQ